METLPEAESADTPEALCDLKTTQAAINNALSQLPSHKRAAYELIKEEEKTYKQVSEILNIPVSTNTPGGYTLPCFYPSQRSKYPAFIARKRAVNLTVVFFYVPK